MYPPVGRYGVFGAYSYTADDGNTYQIGVYEYLAFAGAGDLSPALPNLLPLDALWTARHMVAKQDATIFGAPGDGRILRVPCNESNIAYAQGPGAQITILGATYTVVSCVGERRSDNV